MLFVYVILAGLAISGVIAAGAMELDDRIRSRPAALPVRDDLHAGHPENHLG